MQLCESNPDLFFSDDQHDIETAKDACLDCPLSRFNACQEEGWRNEYGVWGGLSHFDRKKMNPRRYQLAVSASKRESRIRDTEIGNLMRARALDMMNRGVPAVEIAKELGVKRDTVYKWAERAQLS